MLKPTNYDPIKVASAFIYEDNTPSYVLGTDNVVWFIHNIFDEDGEETDDIHEAVCATVFNSAHGYTTVNLELLHHPEIQ